MCHLKFRQDFGYNTNGGIWVHSICLKMKYTHLDTGQENSMIYYNSSRDKIRCEQNGSKT